MVPSASQDPPPPARPQSGVWTVPNALSAARLAAVPLFLWLILDERDGWALLVLSLAGLSDYLDGKIARRFHLESRLGAMLDPVADRLYIGCAVIGLAIRHIVPWWLVALLFARDVFILLIQLALLSRGRSPLTVEFIGKAATFNLLYSFPLL
ncbi:MAG: CDP-alcohol phosphatidyltransferase family protein, partial [Angustibacter sp.]